MRKKRDGTEKRKGYLAVKFLPKISLSLTFLHMVDRGMYV